MQSTVQVERVLAGVAAGIAEHPLCRNVELFVPSDDDRAFRQQLLGCVEPPAARLVGAYAVTTEVEVGRLIESWYQIGADVRARLGWEHAEVSVVPACGAPTWLIVCRWRQDGG